ncbi:MAG TPA: response regulator, partial [Blastocatellia bacterium]|nr:response regulator [Blastocatellia bacterium]
MSKQTHTILVVDDELINRKMLARLLEADYRPLTASSGQEALEILRRERVSLVIADQRMPGMSGTELLASVHSSDPEIVCMMMSAVNDTEVLIDAITKSGAVRMVNKPWDSDKLLQDIQSLLEKY